MSLKFKLVLLTSLLVVLILATVAVVLIQVRSREIKAELATRNTIISERIVPDLALDLANYYSVQFDTYAQFSRLTTSKYSDILHFRIINRDGQVLADSSEFDQGKYNGTVARTVDPSIKGVIDAHATRQDFTSYQGSSAMRIFVPYIDNYGTYRLMIEFTFSLKSIDDEVASAVKFFLVIFGISIVVGVSLSILLAQSITRPVQHLTQSAQAISGGNLDVPIRIESRDEIGVLAGAFREMVASVKKSQEDLLAKITELERVIRVTVGRELRMIELKKELKDKEPEVGSSDINNPTG